MCVVDGSLGIDCQRGPVPRVSRFKHLYWIGTVAAAVAGLTGCTDSSATEVRVRFDAEGSIRSRAHTLTIQVFESQNGEALVVHDVPVASDTAWPVVLPVRPRGGDASRRFTVVGELRDRNGTTLGEQHATSGFVAGRTVEIYLLFEEACISRICGFERTCRGGACASACTVPGELGATTPSPSRACPAEHVLALGDAHTCIVTSTGRLLCWGANDEGQLGLGSAGTGQSSPGEVTTGAARWASVAADAAHTCAIDFEGRLFCWGANARGQLGLGDTEPRRSPAAVTEPSRVWRRVAAGAGHTCAVEDGGTLYCWGAGTEGQLGNGSEADSHLPVEIGSGAGARYGAITAGAAHTCAIQAEAGTLECWGRYDPGDPEEGIAPLMPAVPTQLTEWQWVEVDAGECHTCGLLADGDLRCWGCDSAGQQGDGTTSESPGSPPSSLFEAPSDWAAVAAAAEHSCGVTDADRSLWCWGDQSDALGFLGAPYANPATRVDDDGAAWRSIDAGRLHSCGVQLDGTVWCWGDNGRGQRGDADPEPGHRPRRIVLPE